MLNRSVFLLVNLIIPFLEAAGGPQSPCPNIFQYHYNGQDWYGIVSLSNVPYGSEIRLNVKLSVAAALPTKYSGSVTIIGSTYDVLQAIRTGQVVQYKVLFPLSLPLPEVTAVLLNGRIICNGPHATGPVITSITLEHALFPSGRNLQSNFQPHLPFLSTTTVPTVLRTLFPKDNQFSSFFQATPPTNVLNFNRQLRPFINFNPLPTDEPVFSSTPATVVKPQNPWSNVYSGICGLSENVNLLVANGKPTKRGAYPWLTAVFIQNTLGVEFMCGGNLISKKHVLTAAHCIQNRSDIPPRTAEEILVILGKYKIHKWTEQGSLIKEAEDIIMHPDYKYMSADADLAIIVLIGVVEFTATIKPLCVWPAFSDLSTIVDKYGTIVGWGKDENGLTLTPEPRETKVQIVSQEKCLRSHWKFRDITSERTLCAGGEKGAGPCSGDSGGGLLILQNGQWFLRGVVSMSLAEGTGCDLKNYAVFVDTAKFTSWINQFVV